MASWLDAEKVGAVLGADLAGNLDQEKLDEQCDAAAGFVEDRRRDLFVSNDEDPPVVTFEPGPHVVWGAAMLAYRLYERTKSPLGILGTTDLGPAGILREDPDIARMLGIGRARRFRSGGARRSEAAV